MDDISEKYKKQYVDCLREKFKEEAKETALALRWLLHGDEVYKEEEKDD